MQAILLAAMITFSLSADNVKCSAEEFSKYVVEEINPYEVYYDNETEPNDERLA